MHPLIRTTLIEDVDCQKEYGLTTDAVISFGDFGISVQRSELYDAVRKFLSGELAVLLGAKLGTRAFDGRERGCSINIANMTGDKNNL